MNIPGIVSHVHETCDKLKTLMGQEMNLHTTLLMCSFPKRIVLSDIWQTSVLKNMLNNARRRNSDWTMHKLKLRLVLFSKELKISCTFLGSCMKTSLEKNSSAMPFGGEALLIQLSVQTPF